MQRGSARRALANIGIGIVAFAVAAQAVAAPVDRWQWLENTYWYVPAEYLLALASSPTLGSPIPVSDQTVYHIVGYASGYFWGPTAVTYMARNGSTASGSSCLQLVGSVTPEGQVHLTFTLQPQGNGGAAGNPPTVGLGTMTRQKGAWTMENQMSTAAVENVLLTHWAYMYQCKPDAPCFADLPGSGSSVPEFLAPCVLAGPAG
jgi:hypothetical protein